MQVVTSLPIRNLLMLRGSCSSFRVKHSQLWWIAAAAAAAGSFTSSNIRISSTTRAIAAALTIVPPSVRLHPTCLAGTTPRFMSSSSDEVQKSREAAVAYKNSDLDGAGPPTVFDKILSGEWSSNKVFEDDLVLAFRDINPQAKTHVIVIPKHRDGLTQLSKARPDQKELLGHLLFVAQEVGKQECPDGFRVVINDGQHGAQSVYHLHVHVIGGRQMGWPPG